MTETKQIEEEGRTKKSVCRCLNEPPSTFLSTIKICCVSVFCVFYVMEAMERKGNQKNLSHSLAQCTPLANAGQTGVQPTTLTALSLNADGKMRIQPNATTE